MSAIRSNEPCLLIKKNQKPVLVEFEGVEFVNGDIALTFRREIIHGEFVFAHDIIEVRYTTEDEYKDEIPVVVYA